MAWKTMEMTEAEHPVSPSHGGPPHAEVLQQLEAITTNSLFSKSKRYPNFLRYIVEHTLAGRTDLLKERTLGVEVFHRPSDYDTNADPVVRITAGEIRKRLAQYYQVPGREHELRVDLPLGSYAPLFSKPAYGSSTPAPFALAPVPVLDTGTGIESFENGPVMTPEAVSLRFEPPASVVPLSREGHRRTVRLTLWILLCLSLLAATFYAVRLAWEHARERGLEAFWAPVFHAENPALIVIGVHSFGPDGKDIAPVAAGETKQSMLSSMTTVDMIPLSDVASYSQITDLLVNHAHPYHTQSADGTTFGELQPGPVILIGGLDNAWTLRLTAPLRFHFGTQPCAEGVIEDGQHPGTVWRFNNAQSARSNSRDYAIVASFFDPGIEQRVLIAAGIGKSGTAAATNFLTTNKYLQSWIAQAHLHKGSNVELVLSTEIVEGQQGPPRVLAGYSW